MELREQNILFFTRTMRLGGTENVILQLCEVFKPHVNNLVVCSCGGVNVEKLETMGIKHYEILDIENKAPIVVLKTAKQLIDIVKKEKITVIHTHHRMAAFYVSILGLYKKCYFFNTSHNTFSDRKMFTQFAYRHARLIACGEKVRQNLIKVFAMPESQVGVIHNAVKPFHGDTQVDPVIQSLREHGCFIVGNVGRLSKQKGFEYYIRAVPYVLERHPEARFLIIGAGEDEKTLRTQVQDAGLSEAIIFLGYRSDIQNVMSQLELIVLSSLWEGLPLTPIEAFSVGKTVIGTNVDGTPELIENEVNGIIVEAKNEKQLATKINWMIEHPTERHNMEKEAKKRYESEFSFETFADKYINYYRNAEIN